MKARLSIDEYLQMVRSHCESFFPHHERAKWQDEDSDFMRKNIHKIGTELNEDTGLYECDPELGFCFMSNEDFSQSYTHAPKYEHAGRFFHSVSTTLYTCILYIPLDAASDDYINPEKKKKLHQLFKDNNQPPILCISIFGLSPDPHHTTAFVQHFHEKHLIPWVRKNFPLAKRKQFVRSDGCTGQFKCGRHFRWISQRTEAGGIVIEWSHSESCHGKDAGDREGGRVKFLLEQREMAHTRDNPTQMDTSEAVFQFCTGTDPEINNGRGNMQPQRDYFLKKGLGCYDRVFFYIGVKDVRHNLPECDSVKDSSKMHQFNDIGRSGFVRTRQMSCHRCSGCIALKPSQCQNLSHCGPLDVRQCNLTSSGRAEVPLLRSAPARSGAQLAPTLKVGDFVAIELDDVQVPWILGEVIVALHTHDSGDLETWMGSIKNGDKVLVVRRLEPVRPGSLMYMVTDKETHVFDTDVRLNTPLELVETRASKRNNANSSGVKRYTLKVCAKLQIDELCASTEV